MSTVLAVKKRCEYDPPSWSRFIVCYLDKDSFHSAKIYPATFLHIIMIKRAPGPFSALRCIVNGPSVT